MTSYQNNNTIERIQKDLQTFIGERLKVKANLGRSKTVEAVGILEEAHPKLFIMNLTEGDLQRRVSYSYADLLTQTVELTLFDSKENLLTWLNS